MPSFAKVHKFVARARDANVHFERYKRSSLHDLIELLQSDRCSSLAIRAEVARIPQGKLAKYRTAMQYLFDRHPGLHPSMLQFGPLGKANAAKFPKTPMPPAYDPADRNQPYVTGQPPTAFLEQTCEQFLLDSDARNGVILIHLCSHPQALDLRYEGRMASEHIASVLRVAAWRDVPVCSLHMTEDVEVCPALREAYGEVPRRTPVFLRKGHMGSASTTFVDFASSKDNCVVMGFDGTICVHANLFGSPEYHPGPPRTPLHPLICLTNVITSRAVLVNDGALYSKNPIARPYGILDGT